MTNKKGKSKHSCCFEKNVTRSDCGYGKAVATIVIRMMTTMAPTSNTPTKMRAIAITKSSCSYNHCAVSGLGGFRVAGLGWDA